MIDERELWACANTLLLQHGSAAWLFAAKRAEDLLDAGDFRGNTTFLAIADRIQQLQELDPAGPRH